MGNRTHGGFPSETTVPLLSALSLVSLIMRVVLDVHMKPKHNIETGRPTLAGNCPKGSEHKFEPASIKDAEWGRLPRAREKCPVSLLSRSGLIDLSHAVPGLLVRVRRPGTIRGSVLVHLPTLRAHLRGLQTVQSGKEVAI